MNKIITTLTLVLIANISFGQQVARKAIVEHFTNSNCSACASRNPTFYSTIRQYPDLLHIAYHPSAPYPSCKINQHNKAENDARPTFYGIFGSTPRIVVQGTIIPGTSPYNNSALYQPELNQMTSFSVNTEINKGNNNTADVSVVIKKVDTSSLTGLQLYAAIVEDTLFYDAPNGEKQHYDVFRKAVWTTPQDASSLVNVGDSVILTQNIAIHSDWNTSRIYVTAILQDGNKAVVQAVRTETLDFPVSIANITNSQHELSVYPNPATSHITIDGAKAGSSVAIKAIDGKTVYEGYIDNNLIDVTSLHPGLYFISVSDDGGTRRDRWLKL